MPHLYLAPYVGAGTDADPFRPRGSEQPGWAAIDMRATSTVVTGRALLTVPVRDDTIGTYLGDAPDEVSAAVKSAVESRLGLTLDATRLRQIIPELLLLHAREDGTRWRPLRAMRDGVFRVYLGGLWWQARSLAGGSTITESFDKADSTTLGPNLTWTETNSNLEVFSNACRAVVNNGSIGEARAESDLATDDHYAQVVGVLGSATPTATSAVRALARFSASARTHYLMSYAKTTTPTHDRLLGKRVAGTITTLASTAGISFTDGDTVRVQCNGSTITGLRNGTQEETTTDTEITGNTRAGVSTYRNSSSNIYVDTFEAGDLGQTLSPSAVGSGEAFGTAKINQQVRASGVASAEAHGSPVVSSGALSIAPAGLSGAEAFGLARLNQQIRGTGIGSAEAIGAATLTLRLALTGIGSAEAIGGPKLNQQVRPAGIGSAEAIGGHVVSSAALILAPTGIGSAEALGTPRLNLRLLLAAIASGEAVGVARLRLTISPGGIGSAEVVSSPTVIRLLQQIFPSGIISGEAIGAVVVVGGSLHFGQVFLYLSRPDTFAMPARPREFRMAARPRSFTLANRP